jgi:hypothetical protein
MLIWSSGLQTLISSLFLRRRPAGFGGQVSRGCSSTPSSRLELKVRRLGRFGKYFWQRVYIGKIGMADVL